MGCNLKRFSFVLVGVDRERLITLHGFLYSRVENVRYGVVQKTKFHALSSILFVSFFGDSFWLLLSMPLCLAFRVLLTEVLGDLNGSI